VNKQAAEEVVAKARQIAKLMTEICELARDVDINMLLTEAYPFDGSLDEVECEVIAWRDAMAEKAGVSLCPVPASAVKEGRIRDALRWVTQESKALLLTGKIDERHTSRLRSAFDQLDTAYALPDPLSVLPEGRS
jgi:hypothetical protein